MQTYVRVGWPSISTRTRCRFGLKRRFVATIECDRLFPVEFQQRVARERLGVDADVLTGGHMLMLSQPDALAERLERYRAELRPSPAAA